MFHRKCSCVPCKRGDQFLKDQLARYTDSLCYDCTLSVGASNPTVIKGHKMILARASDAFAKLLYTRDFTEGEKGKDDPITIEDDISPEAVDYVLRWIYGKVGDFADMYIACEVYKFADEWLIDNLMTVAEEKIKSATSDEHLPAYETFKLFGKERERKKSLMSIVMNTSKILSSQFWIKAAPSTIADIFKLTYLQVKSERELFEALVRWGEANSESAADLRRIVAEPLKLIRFRNFTPIRFALLCLEHADVFSLEEKCHILVSLTLDDPNLMPPNFYLERKPRKKKVIFSLRSFGDDNEILNGRVNCRSPAFSCTFRMNCDYPLYMSLVVLDCLSLESNYGQEADLICSLAEFNSGKQVGVARFKGIISEDSEKELEFSRAVPLERKKWYKLSVTYLNQNYLCTKMYQYKPWTKAAWSTIHKPLDINIKNQGNSHLDVSKFQFFFYHVELK